MAVDILIVVTTISTVCVAFAALAWLADKFDKPKGD